MSSELGNYWDALKVYNFRNGGWILDNFPKTRDQWNVMLERGLSVDDIIVLRDESENGDFLLKRWYFLNKREIDQKIVERKAFELEEKRRKEEEERWIGIALDKDE